MRYGTSQRSCPKLEQFCRMLFLSGFSSKVHRLPAFRLLQTTARFRSMSTIESVTEEIAKQKTLFNDLRLNNAEPSAVDEAKKKLGELQKTLGAMSKASGGHKDAGKKKERLLLKTGKARQLQSTFISTSNLSSSGIGHSRLWPRRDVLS